MTSKEHLLKAIELAEFSDVAVNQQFKKSIASIVSRFFKGSGVKLEVAKAKRTLNTSSDNSGYRVWTMGQVKKKKKPSLVQEAVVGDEGEGDENNILLTQEGDEKEVHLTKEDIKEISDEELSGIFETDKDLIEFAKEMGVKVRSNFSKKVVIKKIREFLNEE